MAVGLELLLDDAIRVAMLHRLGGKACDPHVCVEIWYTQDIVSCRYFVVYITYYFFPTQVLNKILKKYSVNFSTTNRFIAKILSSSLYFTTEWALFYSSIIATCNTLFFYIEIQYVAHSISKEIQLACDMPC